MIENRGDDHFPFSGRKQQMINELHGEVETPLHGEWLDVSTNTRRTPWIPGHTVTTGIQKLIIGENYP